MLYVIARGKYSVSVAVSFFEMFVCSNGQTLTLIPLCADVVGAFEASLLC